MTRALNIPALRREWRMSKALKDADLNRDVDGETPTEGMARFEAIQSRHDNRAQAIFGAILTVETASLTIRDTWAILNLALSVLDDVDPLTALPLFRKAERALRALRDAEAQAPEPDEQPEEPPPKLSYRDVLGPFEDKIGDLATIARLIAAHGTNCTLDPSRYQGKQREREERILQDVLIGLGFIRDQAEALETFFGEHWAEVSKSWPR